MFYSVFKVKSSLRPLTLIVNILERKSTPKILSFRLISFSDLNNYSTYLLNVFNSCFSEKCKMLRMSIKKTILVLEDGTSYEGKNFGREGTSFGEIVFNTSMTGYEEIITDPSYAGQIITFTYPEIGNYGTNKTDMEAKKSFAKGIIVKNLSPVESNWRADSTLDEFLKLQDLIGISGIDTRAITRKIRSIGAMRAGISTEIPDAKELHKKVLESPSMLGLDLAKVVTAKETYRGPMPKVQPAFPIVAMDFGIKQNILNRMSHFGL